MGRLQCFIHYAVESDAASQLFSQDSVARWCRGPWIQGARLRPPAVILDSMSRRPIERNAVDMVLCATAVGTL